MSVILSVLWEPFPYGDIHACTLLVYSNLPCVSSCKWANNGQTHHHGAGNNTCLAVADSCMWTGSTPLCWRCTCTSSFTYLYTPLSTEQCRICILPCCLHPPMILFTLVSIKCVVMRQQLYPPYIPRYLRHPRVSVKISHRFTCFHFIHPYLKYQYRDDVVFRERYL